MILRYTKFICDSCFGLIKILYWKSKVNTLDDIASIVECSITVHLNTSQHYLNGEGFQYYNFKDYFQMFKKLPNIQKYHHFYFTSQNSGIWADFWNANQSTHLTHTLSFAIDPVYGSRPFLF
jgi:hypothetical protein